MNETLYQIALTLIPGVGDKTAKVLLAHCGSASAVFGESKKGLEKIDGIGTKVANEIINQGVFNQAEAEYEFVLKNAITPLFFTDKNYPKRLKMCDDGPVMLYSKGPAQLNAKKVLAIVGTRNATHYGKEFCEKFIEDLKPFDPIIVSGLAYGIDIHSHKQALKHSLATVGVIAHGHDRMYPQVHTGIAQEMIDAGGGVITEFRSGTNPDRENFPKRNRIVAGIADAIIVVEASKKGGALITAEIANNYNRDVYAVPGRLTDKFSEGCNDLIRTNKAALLNSVEDLKYLMGWEEETVKVNEQPKLFVDLNHEEEAIWQHLQLNGKKELDKLCYALNISTSKALQHLMSLELKGLVKSHPGKVYSS